MSATLAGHMGHGPKQSYRGPHALYQATHVARELHDSRKQREGVTPCGAQRGPPILPLGDEMLYARCDHDSWMIKLYSTCERGKSRPPWWSWQGCRGVGHSRERSSRARGASAASGAQGEIGYSRKGGDRMAPFLATHTGDAQICWARPGTTGHHRACRARGGTWGHELCS